jgi:hypothetical protein
MTSRPVRQGISGVLGGSAAQKPSRMPCLPLTSIAWDFLPYAAHPVRNPTDRRVRTRKHGGVTGKASDRPPMSIPQILRIRVLRRELDRLQQTGTYFDNL